MHRQKILRREWLRFAVAAALVVVAAALRVWPLNGLELRIPYVTFYPAVMIAALYGGLSAGLVTTVLSALVILNWSPMSQPFIKDAGDWLGMAVFLVNCTMISFIAEAMLRAQARAKKAQEQAEAANQAKSVFLATMSHELRTPLNAILGFSNLMRGDPGITERQRENLDIINRSGKHLLNLINDVLDMAKIEAGRASLNSKPFDLGAMVRDITSLLGPRAAEKELELVLDQSSDFPHFVKGDEEKLRQVVMNLVGNAIKYTDHGRVVLRLGVQSAGEALRLIIEVEDTGVGISKEDQKRIFEPFVQVGQSAAQKGTGLGLAIAREYAELMGGHLTVESTPGAGSRFRLEVPVQKTGEIVAAPAETEKGRIVGQEPGQPAYRVLIVEDQEENWLLLKRLMEDAGFSVEVAQNGVEGIELFQSFRPHFIWMDWRMPLMDGEEATRRIRAMEGGADVKIAAVTASAFVEQRAEMLAAGMDDFIRKPYLPAEIFDCMERHLGVRFVYEPAAQARPLQELSLAGLAALPEGLRRELADGLVLGDVGQLARLVSRIEREDAALAGVLARHLAAFDYLPVLQALEALEETHKEPVP